MLQSDGDALAASRTTLELMATLMESSFEAVGEGTILASMPAYMERFGRDNAQWMSQRFGTEPPRGAGSALSAMNFISQVTDTPYDMVEATRGHAIKRLKTCEFRDAFENRGDFPKTMMCLLHRAAYQGSVNGLVPAAEGFDVQIKSRILFGDDHCDFDVTARGGMDVTKDEGKLPEEKPTQEEQAWLAYGFYTFLLTSFIDYLTHHLPSDQVEQMIRECGRKVGAKVQHLLDPLGVLPEDDAGKARTVLELGGRQFGDGLQVRACPQAAHIIATTAPDAPELQQRVRENACRLCKHFVAGALGKDVERDGAIALGDAHCGFRLEAS
ncbi:MAG: hypothetical protein ACPHID_08225 [Thermoplasmatota archaeon]